MNLLIAIFLLFQFSNTTPKELFTEITPRVFVGEMKHIIPEFMADKDIHVVFKIRKRDHEEEWNRGIQYLSFQWTNAGPDDLNSFLRDLLDTLDKTIEEDNVIFEWSSPRENRYLCSFLVFYFMQKNNVGFEEAHRLVGEKLEFDDMELDDQFLRMMGRKERHHKRHRVHHHDRDKEHGHHDRDRERHRSPPHDGDRRMPDEGRRHGERRHDDERKDYEDEMGEMRRDERYPPRGERGDREREFDRKERIHGEDRIHGKDRMNDEHERFAKYRRDKARLLRERAERGNPEEAEIEERKYDRKPTGDDLLMGDDGEVPPAPVKLEGTKKDTKRRKNTIGDGLDALSKNPGHRKMFMWIGISLAGGCCCLLLITSVLAFTIYRINSKKTERKRR